MSLKTKIKDACKNWWEGDYIPYENDPGSNIVMMGGTTKHHWSAQIARAMTGYLQKEYKWVIGTLIAIIAIIIAVQNLG